MISFFLLRQTVSIEIEFLLNTIIRTAKLIYAQLSFLDIIDNHLTSTSISVGTSGSSHGMQCFYSSVYKDIIILLLYTTATSQFVVQKYAETGVSGDW